MDIACSIEFQEAVMKRRESVKEEKRDGEKGGPTLKNEKKT